MFFSKAIQYAASLTLAAICWAGDGYAQIAPPAVAQGTPVRTICAEGESNQPPNNEVPCYFDVSFTLTEAVPDSERFSVEGATAWDPRGDEKAVSGIEKELRDFAETWCTATAGLSKINKITLYTDGRDGDFRLVNDTGRGVASAGDFRRYISRVYGQVFARHISSVVYRYGINKGASEVVDDDLGEVVAHEFAHSALRLYDEYAEFNRESSTSCADPLRNDDPRETIMNHHWEYKRFSVASDYAAAPSGSTPAQTAQYRCYGQSAWETLVQPPAQDQEAVLMMVIGSPRRQFFNAIPDNIGDDPQPEWGCEIEPDETEELVFWASDARRVVMLIDRSGSMTGEAIREAKNAAKRIVLSTAAENRPIQVGVVEFGEDTFTRVELIALGNEIYNAGQTADVVYSGFIEAINRVIGLIEPRGGTDFQAGLDGVQTLLAGEDQTDAQTVVIMLTDGQDDPPDVSYFTTNDVPIYTVGIGHLDPGVLRGIAQATGGAYHVPETPDEIEEIFLRILRGSSIVDNNQMVMSGRRVLSAPGLESEQTTFESVISGASETANFILSWGEGAALESFTLTRPDGSVIDRAYTRSTTTAGYLQTALQASYSVKFPERGVWTANVRGSGEFEYEVMVASLITAGVAAGPEILRGAASREAVNYPEPIPIIAKIGGIRPIIGANAVAKVTQPDGTTVTVTLRDDGESPDRTAHDGAYSGVLGDYDRDGGYRVEVVINNPDGAAKFGEEGVAADSPALTRAPPFQRVVRGRVEVAGAAAKQAPAPTPDNPIETTPDGSVYWGALERVGQKNWYRFNARAGKNYYLQTSSLMGYDEVEMATGLTLYEHDGATEIGHSAYYRGSNVSSVEWAAPADGAYFVSVAHADEGRGVYALTLNERSLLSEYALERAARSGGGSADYILLLSLIAALSAAGLRRRRHRPLR